MVPAGIEPANFCVRPKLLVVGHRGGVVPNLQLHLRIEMGSFGAAMACQAEAEREKRAKIIAAEGESMAAAALGDASDTMIAHPLALQLRNLQTLVELGVDNNTTVVFPAPLMSAISDVGSFFARETAAASEPPIMAPSANERPRPKQALQSLLFDSSRHPRSLTV